MEWKQIGIWAIVVLGMLMFAATLVLVKQEQVCCKTYGLGVNMTEVNVDYNMVREADCSVPPGFVGGGKDPVEDSFCD